jgi:hypothetical protein
MLSEELLPCPFCGGSASIERYGNARQSTIYQCDNCSCSLETGEEWGHGRMWNARQSPRPLPVGVEEVSDVVGALLSDLCSPFPLEARVVASLGFGDSSIERGRRLIAALSPPSDGGGA